MHSSKAAWGPRAKLRGARDLVSANHILAHYKVLDAFGHVSVRRPECPDRMLLARSRAPALIGLDDILEFDIETSEATAAGSTKVYLERFIHSEIYKRNPEVQAIVHSHSAALIPFGVTQCALRPVYHMGSFLEEVPVFEIRDHAGDGTDLLISSPPLGQALAETLGDSAVVLMRGHGATVVGSTLQEAVFRAIYTQQNASIQMDAMRLGPVTYLSADEGVGASAANRAQLERAWDVWKHEVDTAHD